MNDTTALLHNMSVPPKSVVTYAGLGAIAASLASSVKPGTTEPQHPGLFGIPVRFQLEPDFHADSARTVLRALGVRAARNAESRLEALLDARAAELPLPDGCVTLDPDESHPQIWRDPLTVLAVLTRCSGRVWLRAKQPALAAALERRAATLLVPPAFVPGLPEIQT